MSQAVEQLARVDRREMGFRVSVAEGCPRAAAGGKRYAGDRHPVAVHAGNEAHAARGAHGEFVGCSGREIEVGRIGPRKGAVVISYRSSTRRETKRSANQISESARYCSPKCVCLDRVLNTSADSSGIAASLNPISDAPTDRRLESAASYGVVGTSSDCRIDTFVLNCVMVAASYRRENRVASNDILITSEDCRVI